ncbi:hypothetical protein D3C81_1904190 [compost metagenome]
MSETPFQPNTPRKAAISARIEQTALPAVHTPRIGSINRLTTILPARDAAFLRNTVALFILRFLLDC